MQQMQGGPGGPPPGAPQPLARTATTAVLSQGRDSRPPFSSVFVPLCAFPKISHEGTKESVIPAFAGVTRNGSGEPSICNTLFPFALSLSTGRYFLRASQRRSEEHTSELQSLMRNSYPVFCLQKKNHKHPSPQ